MSFLDQFAAGGWQPDKPARAFDVVKSNTWDRSAYRDEARSIPALDAMIEELMVLDGLEYSPELVRDLWMLAYKGFPQVRGKAELDRKVKVNKQIVDILANNPDLKVLQQYSGGDVALSLVALEKLIPAVKELLENAVPPPPQDSESDPDGKPDEGEQGGQQDGQGEQEQQGGAGQEGGEPGDEPGMDGQSDGQPGEPDEDEWGDEPDPIDPAQAEAILAKGMEDAKDAAQEIHAQESSFGPEGGEWAANADPATRLATANRMKSMKRLLDMVGRIVRFALGDYDNRVTPSENEMYGVQLGSHMQRLLPHQFALLGHPVTKVEFYRRYSAGELLEWKMRGSERVGKGPLVILADHSLSMKGERMTWAVGVVEAMRRIAAKEGRDVYVQFFNGRLTNAFHFPKGKGDLPTILDMLSVQAAGGTSFTQPCDRAMQIISQAGEFEKADIVLVTDGAAKADAGWVQAFLAAKQQHGVRMFSVFIGTHSDSLTWASPTSALGLISDHLIPVQDLTIDAVQDLYRTF